MPPRREANDNEPPVMTWGKAMPVLGVCLIFDLVRLFFEFFWFFGPLLVGAATAGVLSGYIGSWLAGVISGLTGIAAVSLVGAVFGAVGVILAMMVAFAGWLTVSIWLRVSNPHIFDSASWTEKLCMILGPVVSIIPLVGSVPAISFTIWRMYRAQIKHDRETHRAWEKTHQETRASEQAALQEFILQRRLAQAANNNEEIPARAA